MIFIGLLTDKQKQAGCFVSQDEDFIYLWHGKNTDKPDCVGVFPYEFAKIKDIRDKAEADMKEREAKFDNIGVRVK